MKKNLKIIASLTACVVPIAIIVYFATPWNPITMISFVGSSSLQPLMTDFSNEYTDADLIIQGGGSGYGIKAIATNITDVGLASKDPYSTVKNATVSSNGFDKQDWEDEAIKTFTIAFDNIGVVYKTKDSDASLLDINESNIADLYLMFAGIKSYEVKDLIPDSKDDATFIPYSRTGGTSASGTCTSFVTQYQNYDLSKESKDSDLIKAYSILQDGSYTGNVKSTNESNVETWNKLSDEDYDGSITYLSLSFILENYQTINDAGYQIATVNGVNPVQEYIKNDNALDLSFLKEYGWFSFYNIMVNGNKASDATKEFVKWVYFSDLANQIINNLALVGVGNDQTFLKSLLSYYNGLAYSGDDIDANNFIDIFFDTKYSDVARLNNVNEWPSSFSFGISNATVLDEN